MIRLPPWHTIRYATEVWWLTAWALAPVWGRCPGSVGWTVPIMGKVGIKGWSKGWLMDQNFMVGWLVNLWHWCSDFEAYFHELVIFEVPLKKAPVWFGYPRCPFCGPKKVRKSRPVTWASPVDRWAARLIEAEKKLTLYLKTCWCPYLSATQCD